MAAYWGAQLLGGLVGAGLASLLSLEAPALGTPKAASGGAFLAEVLGTFLLVLVILVAVHQRLAWGGVAIGLVVTMAALAFGALSGASINPARWLAPALLSGRLEEAWIYLLAPLVGGALAAWVHGLLLRAR
ncbi:aquaporin [Thermus sp.]|uniref:aquaporin n=1 Tax=Thermus sp. TaxID=275 RepID=UPI003D0C57B0